jgi:hypothetical protein
MLLVKPLIVGAVGGAYTMYQYPLGSINLFSYNMPLSAGVGLALVAGSFLADVAHDYIFPQIHVEDKVSEPVSAVLAGGVNTVGVASVFYLSSPSIVNTLGLPMIAMLGIGSEVIGTYAYEKFIGPMLS